MCSTLRMENRTSLSAGEASADPELFQRIDNYCWDSDNEFQQGLSAILASGSGSKEEAAHLTSRARCYYYARQVQPNIQS